jgi:geranylgeranyl transferase type-2 subunit alpha
MHGVLVKDKKELTEAELQAEFAAGTAAMELLRTVIKSKKEGDMSAIDKTLEILKLNPELGLAWNFRREIILRFSMNCESLLKELDLLNSVMVHQQMTKSYCLWNHRRWILLRLREIEAVDDLVIDKELKLVSTILQLDSRNFHSWSYRKWLCDNFPISHKIDDVGYSLSLIEQDFSNYSAWFLRRLAFDRMGQIPDPHHELELVWNALFTEPTDQSCWQYHDWLIEKEPVILKEQDSQFMKDLEEVVDEKDSKYLLLSKLRSGLDKGEILERLIRIDPMRKGFYSDQMKSESS